MIRRCGHFYHTECLWNWFEQQANCPCCRKKVHFYDSEVKAVAFAKVKSDLFSITGNDNIVPVLQLNEDSESLQSECDNDIDGRNSEDVHSIIDSVRDDDTQRNSENQRNIQTSLHTRTTMSGYIDDQYNGLPMAMV